ncbi:MAG TPA: HD domain-containing phosphohydrolase [Nitrospiria bacterium]|nr:HD domain-containing phosphohydrolase [Nitrospiria bacterium]
MQTEKILIVEDNKDVRDFCADVLRKESFSLRAVDRCADAIRMAESETFDLILTDIKLPDMNGLEFLQTIKKIRHDTSAIIITGYGSAENAINSLKLGVQGFLVKPFSSVELLESVNEILEKARLVKENMRLKLLFPFFEVTRSFISDFDLKSLLKTVVAVAKRETRADTVSIMMLHEDTEELTIEAAIGLSPKVIESAKRKVGERLSGWVAREGKPLIMIDERLVEPWVSNAFIKKDRVSSSICMPLINKNRVIGVLNLSKKRGTKPFTRADVELTGVLCGQAAIAIANLKLYTEVVSKQEEIEKTRFDAIKALAQAIEAKDSYTNGHSERMFQYSLAVAEILNLPEEERLLLKYATALHDIGKIGVDESILRKPSRLTPEEFEEIKTHPAKGASIIKEVDFLSSAAPIIYHHHERYDGKGYPGGLAGGQIPIGSRIVAVLDTYDAMTSDRPYRNALPKEAAMKELQACSGTQFDPEVVDAFLRVAAIEDSNIGGTMNNILSKHVTAGQ